MNLGTYKSALRTELRIACSRESEPSAAVSDSRSVRNTETSGYMTGFYFIICENE